MSNYYVFKPLEEYVQELNPAVVQPIPFGEEQINLMAGRSINLRIEIQSALQDMVFRSSSEEATGQLLRKSHQSLIILINKCYDMRYHKNVYAANVSDPIDETLSTLEQLRHWFHQHYDKYLDAEQLVPKTVLGQTRLVILEKMPAVAEILEVAGNSEYAIAVVTGALKDFLTLIDSGKHITKHENDYHLALLKDIEDSNGQSPIVSDCPSLHELLVYWNLNSKDCIAYFSKGFEVAMAEFKTPEEQLEFLRLEEKHIEQIPELPGFTYNPRYPSIKEHFLRYIDQEIKYRMHKLEGFVPKAPITPESPAFVKSRLRCNASIDQLSLILRAAVETGMLDAPSLSAAFNEIFPHLSTQQKEILSAESARKKSYTAEPRDKKQATHMLGKMIEKIEQDY